MSKWLIDVDNIIDFNRSDAELELLWLFAGVAAGKTARVQAKSLAFMLKTLKGKTPFEKIRRAEKDNALYASLVYSRLGQYSRLMGFMRDSLSLEGKLRTCTVADLEAIHGVGPKTARMFLMFSRPDQRHAALDTHILKHLRAEGYNAPKSTPTGRRYSEFESIFLKLADEAGMKPADYDLMIWRKYSAPAKDRSTLRV